MKTCECGQSARKIEYQTFSYFYCDTCKDEVTDKPAKNSAIAAMIGEAAKDSLIPVHPDAYPLPFIWTFEYYHALGSRVQFALAADSFPSALMGFRDATKASGRVKVVHPDGSTDYLTLQ